MKRLRGLKALVHDAVDQTTELVFEGHESASRAVMGVLNVIEPIAAPARAVDEVRRLGTRGVLGTIRGVNRAVEKITDMGLDAAEQAFGADASDPDPIELRSDVTGTARWIADGALGLVNGAIGDHLHARQNGLELGLSLRTQEAALALDDVEAVGRALEQATPKLAIFAHGLGATEWSWCLESKAYHGDAGASFGSLLARDLDFTPIWVRYNTGRHVSENARLLAREIERLVRTYPVPIEEIVLLGHSMGGLVVRGACHYAQEEGLSWPNKVRRVVCLGSPHHGAGLARFGHFLTAMLAAIDTPGTRIPARILRGRSAGMKDLRYGSLVDEDWLGRDPDALRSQRTREIPLLDHVSYFFVSATVTMDAAHPVGRIVGDLLVQTPSASGAEIQHRSFPIETRHFGGVLHHQLQNHPAVYEVLRQVCERR